MAFITLAPTEVDAKSPVDDLLMGKIKDDLDDLDARISSAGVATGFNFEVIGRLTFLNDYPHKRSLAAAMVTSEFTPTRCRYVLKKSGTSGSLAIDIRKHTSPQTPITAISHQYSSATSSIAQQGSSLNTQSIARATAQIATQSVTYAYAALNITSIIAVPAYSGENSWLYNLSSALSANTAVGDTILIASATSGSNNGAFLITEINRGGGTNFVVTNALGAVQTGAAGTAQQKIMSYNFTNPVSSQFGVGEYAIFAGHTSGANDGPFTIVAINQSGNNIWVKTASGVTQGGVAGNANTSRWAFTFLAAITSDYAVGDYAKMAGHTSGLNDGNFYIYAINLGGNNLIVSNLVGVAQGGAAGTTNTNTWRYALGADPSAQISVGHYVYLSGHTSALNDGLFFVRAVNTTGNNIVVHNVSGVAQGGAVGNTYSYRKVVSFASDQSAVYTTASYIEMFATPNDVFNHNTIYAPFRVIEVNHGGGANYNVVIEAATALSQASPAGYIQTEMKSIFNTAPTLGASVAGLQPNENIAGTSVDLIATAIPANTPIMLYVTNLMAGDPQDLTVSIL